MLPMHQHNVKKEGLYLPPCCHQLVNLTVIQKLTPIQVNDIMQE